MAQVPQAVLDGQKGVYWQGGDGQVYVQGSEGTNAAGQFDQSSDGYWGGQGYRRVQDPSGGQIGSTLGAVDFGQAPSGAGSGGSSTPVLNDAAVRNTQGTIDQIPGLLQAALEAERTRYGNVENAFNTQEQQQRKTYNDSTVTNQQNYDANFMDSIRSGIKGLGGLTQILRGTGASGGTAENQARDVVGGVTASDIRGGADTQQENQTELDGSLTTFNTDLQRRRQEAADTRENNQRAIRRDSNTQLQDLYAQMAGLYDSAGRSEDASRYLDRSGSLTPSIGQDSRTQVSEYSTSPITVKAPELTAFAGPTQPSATTAPNGQIGSGIFTIGDEQRRREQEQNQPIARV